MYGKTPRHVQDKVQGERMGWALQTDCPASNLRFFLLCTYNWKHAAYYVIDILQASAVTGYT